MATYVMSDIHGNKEQFNRMLKKINFNIEEDTLYLLGDYVDWGADPIGLVQQLIKMSEHSENIICLMGNHDKMMYDVISTLNSSGLTDISKADYGTKQLFSMWFNNGGEDTLKKYMGEPKEKQVVIRKWLNSLRYFIPDVEVNGRNYYLCHSKPLLKGMGLEDVLWDRMKSDRISNQFKEKFPDTTLISGHTIVRYFNSVTENGKCRIYKSKNIPYINVDCGAKAFGHAEYAVLGCLRLEDMAEFYIDS